MTDIAHPTSRQKTPSAARDTKLPESPTLAETSAEPPARSVLRRALGEVAAETSRLASKLSPAQLVEFIRASRQPPHSPPPADNALSNGGSFPREDLVQRELFSTFSSLLGQLSHLALTPLRLSLEAASQVRSLLKTQESTVVFLPRRAAPEIPPAAFSASPQTRTLAHTSTTKAIFEGTDLQAPKDSKQAGIAAALEHAALQIRHARQEAKERTQEFAEEDHRRKTAHAREALRARDLQNGIRSAMTDEVIGQIEGPFAISLGTALARIDDINRAEREEAEKAATTTKRSSR